jgi:hypothetical protein
MSSRFGYLRILWTQRVWTRWAGASWAIIGLAVFFRDELLPARWQGIKLPAIVGFLPWQWWVIIFLLIVIIGLFEPSYRAYESESRARRAAEAKSKPNIDILVSGDGIFEERHQGGKLVGKRVQVIVKSLGDSPLLECQAELKKVEVLNAHGSITILDEQLRVEWSNVDATEKFFKITVPAGSQKRVNLFYIECVQGSYLIPLIPHPKEAFMEAISKPGRYKISVLVSSVSAKAVGRQFILNWSDYKNISLEPA